MATDREEAILAALEKCHSGASLRAVATKYGIPRGTLTGRFHGSDTRRNSSSQKQLLDPAQEQVLVDWILNEECAGRCPTRKEITSFAQLILREGGSTIPIGRHWVERFIHRHPAIHMKISMGLEANRARETTETEIRDFWELLAYQITTKDIGPSQITNLDEHGITEGATRDGKVSGIVPYKPYLRGPVRCHDLGYNLGGNNCQ